jgi:hypothetical protein
MKNHLLRVAVLILTFATGLLFNAMAHSLFFRPKAVTPFRYESPEFVSPQPTTPAVATNTTEPQPELSETVELSPYEIKFFINTHQDGDLTILWHRLGIPVSKDNTFGRGIIEQCAHCEAETFAYEFDGDIGDEVLLKISDGPAEAYSYVVFKQIGVDGDRWRALGHVDAWGKYEDSEHMLVLSGGRQWLLIKGQDASGSGVALYSERLFQVTKHGLNEVVSFPSDGFQGGWSTAPEKEFSGQLISCETVGRSIRVTVEFTVTYVGMLGKSDKDVHLFSKRQRAVFEQSSTNRKPVLDLAQSQLSQHELVTIYNIDSMTATDFFHYNFDQLQKIARGKEGQRKQWLREYLKTCADSSWKKELMKLFHAG